jgi:hypothetical protein
MKPSYSSAFGVGAVVGLVLGAVAMLFVGATGGLPKLGIEGEGEAVTTVFAVPASALWIVTILVSAVAGVILAVATRGVARVIDPDAASITLWIITPVGAIVGGVIAFAVFPLGVSLLGSLAEGVATVSVADMVALALVTGVAGGSIVVWSSYVMARPPQPGEDPELLAERLVDA